MSFTHVFHWSLSNPFLLIYSTPDNINLFKVNNGNTKWICEICSKLDIVLGFFYYELWTDITHCFGVFIFDLQQVNIGWDNKKIKEQLCLFEIPHKKLRWPITSFQSIFEALQNGVKKATFRDGLQIPHLISREV